jgi:SEC-C motif-containing protein
MRSHYTAFATRSLDHVVRTRASEVREDFNRAEAERMAEELDWQGLEVRRAVETGDTAEVEFVMRFRRDQQEVVNPAVSRFRREDGEWRFVDSAPTGSVRPLRATKVGRNEPCPCGSGKKAKRCCGAVTELA